MRYFVVHRARLPTGQDVEKWFPSVDYEQMAEELLATIGSNRRKLAWLAVPFVLTLSASLEALLNDWLLLDTLHKHGLPHYRPIADGYLRCSFAKKLRLAVAVITDNQFHLSEESTTTRTLDELIAVRNKVTHPNADFVVVTPNANARGTAPRRAADHPVHSLKLGDCRRFQKAVTSFDHKFFRQVDRGVIRENELVQPALLAVQGRS